MNGLTKNTLKMSKTSIFYLALVLLSSVPTNSIYSQSHNAKSLEIGNKWFFVQHRENSKDTSYISKKVIDDTLINHTRYAVVLTQYRNPIREYERADSTTIYQYSLKDSTEVPIVDFSQQPGDSIGLDYVVNYVDTSFFWGKQRKFIYLSHDFSYLYHEYNCFVEGIGMLSSQYSGLGVGGTVKIELKGAILAQVVYGDTLLTRLENDPDHGAPANFALAQNYPNPFNSTTLVGYQLTSWTDIELSLYDLLGRKIRILEKGLKPPGAHHVLLSGETLASGVYIYRLHAKDIIKSRKCLYIK